MSFLQSDMDRALFAIKGGGDLFIQRGTEKFLARSRKGSKRKKILIFDHIFESGLG